jgi:hypothetical protein
MAKKEETGLVIGKATEGIELINQKIEALKFIRETSYKTSGKYDGRDIRNITEVSELIDVHSSIALRVQAYEASAKSLGLKNYKSKTFDNGTLEQWTEDIALRLQVIEYDSTLKELEGFKKEYEELMDKQDRMELLNKKIAKKFAK